MVKIARQLDEWSQEIFHILPTITFRTSTWDDETLLFKTKERKKEFQFLELILSTLRESHLHGLLQNKTCYQSDPRFSIFV